MKKKKLINKTSAIALALVLLLSLGGFGIYKFQTSPLSKETSVIPITIEKGTSFNQVLELLEENKVIRSAFFAKIQSKFSEDVAVYEGVFYFDPSWDVSQVLKYMGNPQFGEDDVAVQITEGFWAKDIALALQEALGHKDSEYIKLWNDKSYIKSLQKKYPFITDDVLKQKDVRVLLEGYLYPDTYRFSARSTEKQITEIILDNALEKYQSVSDKIEKSEFSIHELYTLASIVEYEASDDVNMRKVAGVFMNRLETGMKLQASPTICYSLYEFEDWHACEVSSNNQIDSPYNTYRYEGLPPGPILNPSIRALEATLDYDKNDYLFFIADVYNKTDTSVHYQKTYEEHEVVRKELLGY